MPKDLTIERVFDAPLELVWKVWSEPELIKKWWGPKNFTAPTVKIDFKVGGKYLLCMSGQPGPNMPIMNAWSTGIYQEIIPLKKIVVKDSFADEQGNIVPASHYGLPASFPMELQIIITFQEQEDKTKITLYYPDIEGIEGMMLDNMTQGWNQSLDKLEQAIKDNN